MLKAKIQLIFPVPICILKLDNSFGRQAGCSRKYFSPPLRDKVKLPWGDNCSETELSAVLYHQTNISKGKLELREAQMILDVDILGFQLQSKGIGPA